LALRYAIGRTKLAINPTLLQPNSEIMLYTTNLNHNLQPISRKSSNICPEEAKVPLDENQSGNRHFLAETPLTDTIANFFPK
jgi:hypothetical protein